MWKMQLGDLAVDVASEVSPHTSEDHFAVIIIMIIEFVVSQLIQWYFNKYVNKQQAAQEFLNYYNNMGPLKKLRLAWTIHQQMKKHPSTNVSSGKIADALAGKFKKLTIEDVISLSEQN
jgi:hypothetical protein